MTLSLLTPTGAVTTSPGHGIIAVQLADFVGAARGTLSVIADGDSLAGNVVKEEQTVAVATTSTSASTSWSAVADTAVIPLASLGMDADIAYSVVVGMKVTGEAPSNAQANSTWAAYSVSQGSGPGWGFGQGFMYGNPEYMAREPFPEYRLYDLGTWYRSGSTDFHLRGWNITGGTMAQYFDMLYLIPMDGLGSAPDYVFNDFLEHFPDVAQIMAFLSNGVVDPDEDDDATSAPWLGDHSVINPGFPFSEFGVVDAQEAEDEPTQFNLNGFGQWDGSGDPPFDDIADPPSWLAMAVGATVADAHQPVNDPLTSAVGGFYSNLIATPQSHVWIETSNIGGVYQPGNILPGWYAEGVARLYIPSASSATPEAGSLLYAGSMRRLSTASASDPSQWARTLQHLSSCIIQARLSINTVTRSAVGVGMVHDAIDNALADSRTYALARLTAAGSLDLSLESLGAGADVSSGMDAASYDFGGGPVNITGSYTASTYIWIKVERRQYYWRAKAWLDGNSEPGAWMVEGQEPLWSRNNALGPGFDTARAHPYDVSYAAGGTAADSAFLDPRGRGNGYEWQFPTLYGQAGGVGVARPHMLIQALDFTVDYDPDGSTPDDMEVRVDKYDGTPLDGNLAVPYGPWRMVLGDARVRRWNLDTNGFNPWLWKDGGSIPLQYAALYRLWERRKNNLFQWGDITRTLGAPRLSGVGT